MMKVPAKKGAPLAERFMARVYPEPNSGCWLWSGSSVVSGYGIVFLNGVQKITAHRCSWQMHRGPIPEGMDVCHRCDTPACVNPDHLFVAPHRENMIDMVVKGRNPKSTIRPSDIPAIRASTEPARIDAARFGVTPQAIRAIRRGETWTHV